MLIEFYVLPDTKQGHFGAVLPSQSNRLVPKKGHQRCPTLLAIISNSQRCRLADTFRRRFFDGRKSTDNKYSSEKNSTHYSRHVSLFSHIFQEVNVLQKPLKGAADPPSSHISK